jgi:putative transcriptional regulator
MQYNEIITNNVYEYRVIRRLTQQELADALGVSKQTVFAMEKGNYSPTLALAFRIAAYFGVHVTDIFSYKKEG